MRLRRNCLVYMSVVCFAATHSLSLASDPIRGRLIGTETVDALLTEDNSDAFIAWRHEKVKHRTIVHIDSHIDLEWVTDSDLRQIFDSKTAEQGYRRALELNPHNGKAYQNLGRLYDMQGDIHRAISAYEKAVENNPCFKAAHNNLGGLYARAGRYDEAINEFRKAVRIDPHYVRGYSNLGKMHLIQGNASGALEAFQHALSIDPKNLWARYYLGRLYIMMSRYGEGISAYEEVIDDNPNFFPAYIDLARILGEKGIDVDRALKLAQKAVELRPTAQTFDLLAWLYFRRGMYEDAEKAIERAVGLDPSNESIIRHREEIRRRMGYR